MIESPYDACARSMALLSQYSFDLDDQTIEQVIIQWLTEHPPNWIDLAVIEALYQGRYKTFSVSQILSFWQRRGKPVYHFTGEFERLVCRNISQKSREDNDEIQESDHLIDDLNNPSQSNPDFDAPVGEIILRPIQAIVVPIKYPDFFGKLKALVEMGSDFLTESDPEVHNIDVIDVPTIENAEFLETDYHPLRKFNSEEM